MGSSSTGTLGDGGLTVPMRGIGETETRRERHDSAADAADTDVLAPTDKPLHRMPDMKTRLSLNAYGPISLLSLLMAAVYPAQADAAGPNSGSSTVAAVTIDQAKAMAGAVTSGDAAGFPVTLSQPGSYRLTGNLVVPDANTTAITITAPNVTLDLAGFTISGPVTCTTFPTMCHGAGTGDGIAIDLPGAGERAGVSVANGNIRGMGRSGVRAVDHDGIRLERLFVIHSGGPGVALYGGGVVVDSQVLYNGQIGILGNNLALFNNLVRSNAATGIVGNTMSVGAGNVIQGHAVNVTPGGMRSLGTNWCESTPCP